MCKIFPVKKYFLLFVSIISLYFISCSQNLPEIGPAESTLIFEYDENNLPDTRLSVFVQSESDVHRYDVIKVISCEGGFEWETEDLIKLQKNEIQYAGFTNFVMPENEKFPQGEYTVTYINADSQETQSQFYLNYDQKLYDFNTEEIKKFMIKNHGINEIAVYNSSDILIFYGQRTSDLQSNRDIWNKFRDAQYYNDIWITADNTVICILPKEKVLPEKVE